MGIFLLRKKFKIWIFHSKVINYKEYQKKLEFKNLQSRFLEKSINMGIGHYFRAKKVGGPKKLLKETNFFFYLIANIFFCDVSKALEKKLIQIYTYQPSKQRNLFVCSRPRMNKNRKTKRFKRNWRYQLVSLKKATKSGQ